MSIGFRHADARLPFLWESAAQPAGGEGPCQYLADTPDGAWAEFLRHEEITDPIDLAGVARSLWAIDVPATVLDAALPADAADMLGGPTSYPACQRYARAQRRHGITEMVAPSAALRAGGARGQRTDTGLKDAEDRSGVVWVLFGRRPDLRGWRIVERGAPPEPILAEVRHLADAPPAT